MSSFNNLDYESMCMLNKLALVKYERSYRDLWRDCPPMQIWKCNANAMPSRPSHNFVSSSSISDVERILVGEKGLKM